MVYGCGPGWAVQQRQSALSAGAADPAAGAVSGRLGQMGRLRLDSNTGCMPASPSFNKCFCGLE